MPTRLSQIAVWPLLKKTGSEWVEDKASKMAASLAYYTASSIVPLFVASLGIASLFAKGRVNPAQLKQILATFTDSSVADAMGDAIQNANHSGASLWATVIGLVVAIFSASGLFSELQDSLNTIWEVRPKPNRGIKAVISDRFLPVTMVLGSAFVLLVSTILTTILSHYSSGFIGTLLGTGLVGGTVVKIIVVLFITAVVTVLFAAMFKALPDATIAWRDVWLGALFTSILFQIGKVSLGLYLAKAAPQSAFGAVGSVVVLLVWVYYSAQIFYFGAEFTQVFANGYGSKIIPTANAEPLTEERRMQAGIPHQNPAMSTPGSAAGRAPAPRPVRAVTVSTAARTVDVSLAGRRWVLLGVPVLAMTVIGRSAVRQYVKTHPHQVLAAPTLLTVLRDQYQQAFRWVGHAAAVLGRALASNRSAS